MLATALTCALAPVAAYLAFGVVYQLFYAVTGLLPAPEPVPRDDELRRFAVFITARKADRRIVETARKALKQRYPRERFEVYVLADRLRASTLAELRHLDATTLVMGFSESTEGKCLREGILAARGRDVDAALVLDADHRMAPDFLLEANRFLAAGFRVVQGQCTVPPKRLDHPAGWDAISAAVDNHILRAGHHAIGLSAKLAGSGMAFDFALFEAVMQDVHAAGGFAEELALQLIRRGESIAYAERARVYDEGVADVADNRRWLASPYSFARRYFGFGARALFRGRFDFADQAAQTVLPPRLLLPVSLLALMTATLPYSLAWSATFASLLLLSAVSFALAIPPRLWESASWILLSKLPELVWVALQSAVQLPASAKTSPAKPEASVTPVKLIAPGETARPTDGPSRPRRP